MHPLEEFMNIAPEEARSEEILKDEHQLLLRRLNLELSERTRCVNCISFKDISHTKHSPSD